MNICICLDKFLFFRIIVLNILKDSVLRSPSHENSEEEIVLDDVTRLFR